MVSICDTGPLVAGLNRNDPEHKWAAQALQQAQPPLLVCGPVLTEATYFLRDYGIGAEPVFELLDTGALRLEFEMAVHWRRMRTLMGRYSQMDLADAAIVVMSELHPHCRVLTLDRKDFSTYRRNDRQVIPFLAPPRG